MSSSSSVVESAQRLVLLLLLPWPMTSSPFTTALWRRGNRVNASNICQRSETPDGGLTVRCSGLRLTQVPVGVSNFTIRLFLDKNLLNVLPADSFSDLSLLDELDLSHNQLSSLEAGCFHVVASSLRFLDLSSNQLSSLDLAALGGVRAQTNLTQNPWHCDCRMQLLAPRLDLDRSSLSEVVCQTSDLQNLGAVGMPLVLLLEDWDLCRSVRRKPDVVMLLTMFLWFSAVISYLVYYIRHHQQDVRQHMEYLKARTPRHLEDTTEDDLEDRMERHLEDTTEDDLEDRMERHLEDTTEDDLEDRMERHLEDTTEDDLEDRMERHLEDMTEEPTQCHLEDPRRSEEQDQNTGGNPGTTDVSPQGLLEHHQDLLEHVQVPIDPTQGLLETPQGHDTSWYSVRCQLIDY